MSQYGPELHAALQELKRITGVSMDIHADTPAEEQAALSQIRCLCAAYKEKYNKTDFLQNLMAQPIPSYDVRERALRLRIDPEEERVLFLLEVKGSLDDTVLEVLKNLFPSQSRTHLVPMSECSLAVLHPADASESEEKISRTARQLVDTLNTEALVSVQVAYSKILPNLLDLPSAFRDVSLALRVGQLFYSERTVFPYNRLGIGRLICRLPGPVCESFLHEIYGEEIPERIEEETMLAADRFFQNNLNIAETARQLHMHRNTLIYRLEQIQKRTGLDLRRFEDAMTFKVTSMVLNYLQAERNHPHE